MELTELRYSTDTTGWLKLYLYYPQSEYHQRGVWFGRKVEHPREEIPLEKARKLAEDAIAKGREVRICNGGDHLVFRAVGGKVVYPENVERFWEQACRERELGMERER